MDQICQFCGCKQFTKVLDASSFDDGKTGYSIIECDHCKIALTVPILTLSELDHFYASAYYGQRDRKFISLIEGFTKINHRRRAQSILSFTEDNQSQVKEPLRVLDIGCGRGSLLKSFAEAGWDCYGVERDGFLFPNDLEDIKLYTGELAQLNFESEFFDVVILWHSLEHLQNPGHVIAEARRILKRKGRLVIAAPNFNSLQRRLFNRFWFHLDLPRHCYHFGLEALKRHLEDSGFKITKTGTLSFEQNPYGFIQSTLNYLAPFKQPNRLYALLKARSSQGDILELILWLLIALLILPFSILESLAAGVVRKGAVFTIYGMKPS